MGDRRVWQYTQHRCRRDRRHPAAAQAASWSRPTIAPTSLDTREFESHYRVPFVPFLFPVSCLAFLPFPPTPRDYNDAMASQDAPANAKRLLKALIDRGNPVAPEGRISRVAADTGLNEGEIRPAIKYAKAQGWLEDAKFGHTRGWLSITPSGKAAAES
jgi:hypothetical protein